MAELSFPDGEARLILRIDSNSRSAVRRMGYLDRHQQAWDDLQQSESVYVPEILWRDPQGGAVLMTYAQGDTADRELDLSELGLSDRSHLFHRIGCAVSELHRVSKSDVRRFWPRRFIQNVQEQAEAVRSGHLHLKRPKRFLGLCAYLHRAARAAQGQTFVGAVEHGDLHMRNILVSETTITFIDFTNQNRTYHHRDLASLWLANGMKHLPITTGAEPGFGLIARQDLDAFETGYGMRVSEDPIFRFFYALRLQENWLRAHNGYLSQAKLERRVEVCVKVLEALLASETAL